jgi:hypothetical protein
MTFAGKKLQDIYDSGADRLSDLEGQALNKLKRFKDDHAEKLKSDVEGCVGRVKGTASELTTELGTYIDGGLQRLRNVIDSETRETNAHTQHLVAELTNLSDKLNASIAALKKAYKDNVEFIKGSSSDRFVSTVERAKLEFEKHDYGSSRHLKAHGTFVANSLQQKLDHVLWESRGDEKQVTGSLFKSYMQKANAIDSHFSALMQKLSSEFQSQYKDLEGAAKRSESSVESEAKTILQRVDDHAGKVEHEISEHFKKVSEQHRQKLDNDLSTVADDLSRIHDTTTEKLGDSTEQLSESLLGASAQAQEALKVRCDDLKQKINTSTADFAKRMAERLRTSTDLKASLEGDRDDIVSGIRVELSQIQDAFEKKVISMIAQATERVKKIAGEAEGDIKDAQKNCDDQLAAEAKTARSEIDKEVEKFLELLGQHRSSALDQIIKAAGNANEGAGIISSKPTARQKKVGLDVDTEDKV